jgi:hypothetical protein
MRSLIPTLTAALALSITGAASGRAQPPTAIAEGARVRLDLATGERSPLGRPLLQTVVGTVESAAGDTLLLALRPGAASLRVARTSVHAAYLSGGRPGRWRAAIVGAAKPAILGAALSAVSMSIRGRRDDDPTMGSAALSSAAWGAASGALFSAWAPNERWHRLAPLAPAAPRVAAAARDSAAAFKSP